MELNSFHRPVGLCAKAAVIYLALFLHAVPSKAQEPKGGANLSYNDREQWHKVLRWPEGCEQSFSDFHAAYPNEGGIRFYGLGRGRHLVIIECYRGTYVSGELFMIYDEAKLALARLLKLKGFDGAEDESGRHLSYPLVYGEAAFHEKTKVLEILSKSNGTGSCGLYVKYRFIGSRPMIVEAREKRDCIGGVADPYKWPRKRL